jgi:hypothetical protein
LSGASGSGGSNSGRLRFDSKDNALDFANESVERARDWFAFYNVNALEQYLHGNIDIVLNARTGTEPHVFDLVFRRVPSAVTNLRPTRNEASTDADVADHVCHSKRDQDAVRFGVPYAVQGPQQLIPSLVWLETSKERTDFRRYLIEATGVVQLASDAGSSLGERETGSFGAGVSKGDGAGVDSVIQGIPQVGDGILHNEGQVSREIGGQFHLEDLLLRLSIHIDAHGVWPRVQEGLDLGFEIVGMVPCATDELLRAFKRHG